MTDPIRGEADHDLDAYGDLARLIVREKKEPPWLRQGLANAVGALWFALNNEKKQPYRRELIERLTAIQEAAALLKSELPANLYAVEGKDQAGFGAIHRTVDALTELAPFIDAAIAAVPQGQGSHKHYPHELTPPLSMCADFVSVAWCVVHGEPAPHTSADSQGACQELWDLAGGGGRPQSSADAGSIKGWRDHLGRSKNLSPEDCERYRTSLLRGSPPR